MQSAAHAVLDRVDIVTDDDMITVYAVWKDVDRPVTMGYGLGHEKRDLAERLARAMEDGAAFSEKSVVTDNEGKSFVSTSLAFRFDGRRLGKDLKALGF